MFTIPKKSFYYDEKKDCNVQYCLKERVRKAFSHILMCVFILMNANIFFACSEKFTFEQNCSSIWLSVSSLSSHIKCVSFYYLYLLYGDRFPSQSTMQFSQIAFFLLSVFFQQRNVNFYIFRTYQFRVDICVMTEIMDNLT